MIAIGIAVFALALALPAAFGVRALAKRVEALEIAANQPRSESAP